MLLYVTDDQAYQTLALTPAVRQRFDVRFTSAYATTPLCCPSRATIYSGQYVHNHGIDTNDGRGFDARETWLWDLKRAGYEIGIVGKWLSKVSGQNAGIFDFARTLPAHSPTDTTDAKRYAKTFLNQADVDDSRPWALVVATSSPHAPYEVTPQAPRESPPLPEPPSYIEQDLSDKHPAVAEQWSAISDAQFDQRQRAAWEGQTQEIFAVSEMVVSVSARLRTLDEQDTLEVYISDNGYMFGEHRLNGKRWPYLETAHVPLLMRWAGHTIPRSADPRLVANVDLAPTIYDATDVRPRRVLDGRSLLAGEARDQLFLESDGLTNQPRWQAILTPDRHYIRWEDGTVEDYDLDGDPYEMVASGVPDPAMETLIAAAATCTGEGCP